MKVENLIVKFDEPYKFEEETIKELDLSGLKKLKAIDLINCQNELTNKGKIKAVFETDIEYLFMIANRATGKPIEFFNNLPIKQATSIKTKISNFLVGAV